MLFLTRLLSISILASGLTAGAELHLSSATVSDDSSARLELRLTGGERQLTALQCDIEHDGQDLNITVESSPETKEMGKDVFISRPDSKTIRIIVAGLNKNALIDGTVAILKVSIGHETKDGQQHNLRVSRATASTKDAVSVDLATPDNATVTERAEPKN